MIRRLGMSGIIFIAIISLKILIWILNWFDIYLQFQYQFNPLLSIVIIIFGFRLALRVVRDIVMKRVVISLGVIGILLTITSWWVLHSDDNYLYFTSPDKDEEFVIIENTHSEIYQISKLGMFMFHLTDVSGDDGYRMFSDKRFMIEWKKPDQLTIYYADDYMTPNQFNEVTVQYINY